ncbi:hypothetical protein ASG01_08320 [Chryseobacterium sp. Leaf180]|nr:hypothetical protein ASG01_08320 [Chryseobacterium sp. Leaf180]
MINNGYALKSLFKLLILSRCSPLFVLWKNRIVFLKKATRTDSCGSGEKMEVYFKEFEIK